MGNFLNLVYDNWDSETTYKPNLENIFGVNKFKILDGLIRFYGLYDKMKACKIQDVYDNPNEKFYYFINPNGNGEYLFNDRYDIGLIGEVEQCFMECDNFFIIYLNEHEYEKITFIKLIDQRAKNKLYDLKRIYFINNDSRIYEYKNILNTDINVYALEFLLMFIAGHLSNVHNKFKPEKEGKFFLCHNRSHKPHRYALLVLLKKSGLIDDVDWSLIMGWNRVKNVKNGHLAKHFYEPFFNDDELDFYKDEIEYFDSIDIKKSQYEEDTTWFGAGELSPQFDWKDIYELKSFEESYVNIVTESNYFTDCVHITEKSIKPFHFHQIPIFLSGPNHVKYFKNRYDFDFFDDIIDHSYDSEMDNKKRIGLVFNEIKRVSENKEQIKEFYKNNQERFEKNKEKVKLIHNSKRDVAFFNSLFNKRLI
jgi:hypothetical protein